MNWWARGTSRVPLLPALAVVVGLALVMLAGHVWQRRQAPLARTALDWRVMLALPVYLFLAAAAGQPALAVPPWPLFAAVAVFTPLLLVADLALTRLRALLTQLVLAPDARAIVKMSFGCMLMDCPFTRGECRRQQDDGCRR